MTTAALLHRPSSTTPAISSGHELAMARAGIRDALAANHYQRLHYAISARDHAAAVLDDGHSSARDRRDARYYLVEAEAIIAAAADADD